MSEQCNDNRFEIIKETKEYIINATNIDTSPDEMKVLDDICFRLWQLGLTKRNKDKLNELENIISEDCIAGKQIGLEIIDSLTRRIKYYRENGNYLINELKTYKEKTKESTYTLEEVKQTWEEAGYHINILSFPIHISFESNGWVEEIEIYENKEYESSRGYFTFQEHQLLTKTLKALEKEEK